MEKETQRQLKILSNMKIEAENIEK